MSWLTKTNKFVLHQGSDIPYVILSAGVRLCFDNFYQSSYEHNQYNISFAADKKNMTRQSTNYFRFKEFPITIPFADITKLNGSAPVLEKTSAVSEDTKSVILINDGYLKRLPDQQIEDLSELAEEFDSAFLLTGSRVSQKSRLLDIPHVYHPNKEQWSRTCVRVAHEMGQGEQRGYCWTHVVPSLSIACFGLNDRDDMEMLQKSLDDIEIQNHSVSWED